MQLVGDPESDNAKADHGEHRQREHRRETTVELRDVPVGIAAQDDTIRSESEENPGNHIGDVVLLGEHRGDRDERRTDQSDETQAAVDEVACQRRHERVRHVQRWEQLYGGSASYRNRSPQTATTSPTTSGGRGATV